MGRAIDSIGCSEPRALKTRCTFVIRMTLLLGTYLIAGSRLCLGVLLRGCPEPRRAPLSIREAVLGLRWGTSRRGEHRELNDNRKVLIVDDEKAVSETLTKIFRSRGYQARAVHSAEEAIGVLAEWQPDLVLLDVNLPGMNGVDLAKELKISHPDCLVLLFSDYPSTDDLLQAAMQDGHVFEIISKPVHPTVLLDAVASSLADTPDRPPTEVPEM